MFVFATVPGSSAPAAQTPPFLWNLNGILSAFAVQPGTFDTMLVTDPALAGPGPFDGTRLVLVDSTITLLTLILRVPPVAQPPNAAVELYRIRAGVVETFGQYAATNIAPNNFGFVAVIPAVTDLLAGDILFVALAQSAVGTEDLTLFLEVSSP